jgi:hypothetical protein
MSIELNPQDDIRARQPVETPPIEPVEAEPRLSWMPEPPLGASEPGLKLGRHRVDGSFGGRSPGRS